MIDTTLIETLGEMVRKEKKLKGYKRRVRAKGRLAKKSLTKSVIKTHKERFAIAKKLAVGKSVSAEGIPKFRMVICTRLKVLGKGILEERQERLI